MKNIGTFFESKAEKYLVSLGYKIYKKNVRINRREIDLIAIYDNTTILIEVKYRSSFLPELSKKQKQNLLEFGLLMSEYYSELPTNWRIDLIIFMKDKMVHQENIYLL